MYLINTFLNVVVTQVTYSVAEIQVMEDKDFRNDQTVDLFLCCLFLSPSGTFTLIYNVVYFISVIWATYTWREYDDKNFAQSRLQWMIASCMGTLLFIILQKRELRNFHQTQDAIKKQGQLT